MFLSVLFLTFVITFVNGKPSISYDELIHVKNSLNTLSDEILAFQDSITGRNGQQSDEKLKKPVLPIVAKNFTHKILLIRDDLSNLKDVLVKEVEKTSPDQFHEHFKATKNEDFLTLGRNNQKSPIHQTNDVYVVVEKVGEPLLRNANGKIVKDANSKNVVVEKVGEPLLRNANGKIVKDASSKNVVVVKVGEPLLRDANGKIVKDASSKNVVVEKVGEPLLRNPNGKIVEDASSKNVVVEKIGQPLLHKANGDVAKETQSKNDKSTDLEQTLSQLKDALVMLKDTLANARKSALVKRKYPLKNTEENKDVSLLSQLDHIKGEVQSIEDLKTLDKAVDEQVRKSDEETATVSKKDILVKKFEELDQKMAEIKDIMVNKMANR